MILNKGMLIVLNGFINVYIGMLNLLVYVVSKVVLILLVKMLLGELVGLGICVNVVSFGLVIMLLYGKFGLDVDMLVVIVV